MEYEGVSTYEQYVEMRDYITNYTSGHLMVTSWRWNEPAVTPGESAGVCVGDPERAGAYWSCWEYQMREDGEYHDMAKSYLVNPSEFVGTSRLALFENISE